MKHKCRIFRGKRFWYISCGDCDWSSTCRHWQNALAFALDHVKGRNESKALR